MESNKRSFFHPCLRSVFFPNTTDQSTPTMFNIECDYKSLLQTTLLLSWIETLTFQYKSKCKPLASILILQLGVLNFRIHNTTGYSKGGSSDAYRPSIRQQKWSFVFQSAFEYKSWKNDVGPTCVQHSMHHHFSCLVIDPYCDSEVISAFTGESTFEELRGGIMPHNFLYRCGYLLIYLLIYTRSRHEWKLQWRGALQMKKTWSFQGLAGVQPCWDRVAKGIVSCNGFKLLVLSLQVVVRRS